MKLTSTIGKLANILNHPGTYLKSEIEKVKRNARHKISEIIVKVILFALMGLVALLILVFGSVTAGLWLNEVTDSSFLGFLIVTGFYVLLLVILLLIKDKDKITHKMFGFAKRAVAVELESPRMFEQDPQYNRYENGREKREQEKAYYS